MEQQAAELSTTLMGFRRLDGVCIDVDSVLRWVYQFPEHARIPLLSSLNVLFGKTYISAEKCDVYLRLILLSPRLAGPNPREFWSRTFLIDSQTRGSSQRILKRRFEEVALREFGPNFNFGGNLSERAFYLDDFIFSGQRAKDDFTRILQGIGGYVERKHLDMCFFGVHSLGEYFLRNHADNLISEAGLRGRLTYEVWTASTYENRRARRDVSHVLWPTLFASQVGCPEFDRLAHTQRGARADNGGDWWRGVDRELLEREFLGAGCRIVESCGTATSNMRPLGYYNFGYGFGALCATFLNCPNNAPLALWWSARTQGMPNGWHPLLPRRVND